MGKLTRSSHFWVSRSKSINFSASVVTAKMCRPSGDQRGENRFFASGNRENFPVPTSTIAIPGPSTGNPLPPAFKVTTMDLPSGDQLGSYPNSAPGTSSRRSVPSLETRYARQPVFKVVPMNTICLPSGDHCGKAAIIPSNLNCTLSLPSTRLRQSWWSGTEMYVIHIPSRENARSFTDTPPRNGVKPDLPS